MKGFFMHSFPAAALATGVVMLSIAHISLSQERDRNKIPETYKWNLAEIYPSDEAWKKAKEQLVADIPAIEKFEGTLGSSSKQLLGCLTLASGLTKEYSKVSTYAGLHSDQDTRDSKYLGMVQEMSQIGATLNAKSSFIEPEILKIDKDVVDGFVKNEPR